MKFKEFLDKEVPGEGGCMVCLAKYNMSLFDSEQDKNVLKEKKEYFLIERYKIANGYIFTINKRPYYDYDFTWEDKTSDWEILYKKEI